MAAAEEDAFRSSSRWEVEGSAARVDAEDGAEAALEVAAASGEAAAALVDSAAVVGSAAEAGDRAGESTMRKG